MHQNEETLRFLIGLKQDKNSETGLEPTVRVGLQVRSPGPELELVQKTGRSLMWNSTWNGSEFSDSEIGQKCQRIKISKKMLKKKLKPSIISPKMVDCFLVKMGAKMNEG